MTEVAFHINVGDKVAYASRLLRKAYLKGSRLMVLGDGPTLEALDRALWLMGQGEFVPHARETDAPVVKRHSPMLLGTRDDSGFDADVLVHVDGGLKVAIGRFARVIELVGNGADDRLASRERWRGYKADGHEPVAHDLAGSTEG